MLPLIILISLFVFFTSCVCFFCFIAKKRDKISYSNSNCGANKSIVSNRILSCFISFINSFVYLYFKIVGYIPSHHIRVLYYKYIFHMKIGKKTVLYYGLEARNPWNITIGSDCSIGDRCIFDARRPIMIADHVNISTGCWIWTVQHDVNSSSFSTENNEKSITIKDWVWISSRTNILPGCDIEEGVVIAAGAVVTKRCIEKYKIYGGIPAKIIGERSNKLNYQLNTRHRLFY